MRVLLSLMVALIVSTPAGATTPADQDPRLIVPSQRIGPAHLGMNRGAIARVNRSAVCPVFATYDALGRAMWLQTNWGGGCLISDKIQVGLFAAPVLGAFGEPDRIVEDGRYPQTTAHWLVYGGRGVAFRILGWFPDAIIQTIAVFPEATPHINSGSNSAAGRSQRLATPIREPHAPRGRALPSVREGADTAAFTFADGRAAHVAAAHTQDAIVTYLAVEAPESTTLPQIGHFAHRANGHAKPLYSDGRGGDGFGPPPADP